MSCTYHFSRCQSVNCRCCGKCCEQGWPVPMMESEVLRIMKMELPDLEVPLEKCFPKGHILKKNGICIFEGKDRLCMIHKKYGFDAKPLACRMFPLDVRAWEDGSVSASVRYDCPAAAFGTEKEMASAIQLIASLGSEMQVLRPSPDPGYSEKLKPGIPRLREIAKAYSAILTDTKLHISVRFYAASHLLKFHQDPGNSGDILAAEDFVNDAVALAERSNEMLAPLIAGAARPEKDTLAGFRFLLSSMLRDDAGRNAVKRVSATVKAYHFMRGNGSLSIDSGRAELKPEILPEKPVADPEAYFHYFRWLDSKLASLHFCGGEFAKLTFEEGMRFMLLSLPSVIVLASALTEQGQATGKQEIAGALQIFDHAFLRTGLFHTKPMLLMAQRLAEGDDYPSLLKYTSGAPEV